MRVPTKHITAKLQNGLRFGLFNEGNDCYFEDGEHVRYVDLWIALRELHGLDNSSHSLTISDLCPDQFVGTFDHKFSKHKWKS